MSFVICYFEVFHSATLQFSVFFSLEQSPFNPTPPPNPPPPPPPGQNAKPWLDLTYVLEALHYGLLKIIITEISKNAGIYI